MPAQRTSKGLDIGLLPDELSSAALIESVLQDFNAAIRAKSLTDIPVAGRYSNGARGKRSEITHHFGPVLKLDEKNGRTVSIRNPWQHIRAVISGLDPQTDGKRLYFGIAKIPGIFGHDDHLPAV
jgi:hypothetical protein